MPQFWTEVTINCDVEVECERCGKMYLLLHRVRGTHGHGSHQPPEAGQEAHETAVALAERTKLPLWQRCYHCGHLSKEGLKQARHRAANETCHGDTNEEVTSLPVRILIGVGALGLAIGLYVSLDWIENLPNPLSLLIIPAFLGMAFLAFAGLHEVFMPLMMLPAWVYHMTIWNPTKLWWNDRWREWWAEEGREVFQMYAHNPLYKSLPWEPKHL